MEENKDLLPDEQDESQAPEVITFTGGITLRAPGAGI